MTVGIDASHIIKKGYHKWYHECIPYLKERNLIFSEDWYWTSPSIPIITFKDEDEAILFKLKFGG